MNGPTTDRLTLVTRRGEGRVFIAPAPWALLLAAMSAAWIFSSGWVAANVAGPPPDTVCMPAAASCSDCHSSVQPPTGQLILDFPSQYSPGGLPQAFYLRVEDPDAAIQGFEVTVVDSSLPPALAGSLDIIDFQSTQVISGTLDSVAHTAAGALESEWRFRWTPPATDIGPVTFYAVAVAGDNDGTEDGDHVYCASAVLNPATGCWMMARADPRSLTVCQGEDVQVRAFRSLWGGCTGAVYEWYLDGNFLQSTPVLMSLGSPAPGAHVLELRARCMSDATCQDIDGPLDVNVGAGTPPDLSVSVAQGVTEVCQGGSLTLDATASTVDCPGGNPVYQWLRNGAPVGSGGPVHTTSPSLSVGNYTFGLEAWCDLSPDCPGRLDPEIYIQVFDDPIPVGSLTGPAQVCEGKTTTVSASGTQGSCPDNGALVYSWYIDDVLDPSKTGETYTTPADLTPGMHDVYFEVTCGTDAACASTLNPRLTFEVVPAPASGDAGGPYIGRVSEWITLDQASVQGGGGPYTYLWTSESPTGVLSAPDSLVTDYMDTSVGSFKLTLQVSDGAAVCALLIDTRVRVVSDGCQNPPGLIGPMYAVKDLAGDPNDIVFSWPEDPGAQGGYSNYMVGAKELLDIARAPWSIPAICETADPSTVTCSHPSAILYASDFLYSVVGVCQDGTEGP